LHGFLNNFGFELRSFGFLLIHVVKIVTPSGVTFDFRNRKFINTRTNLNELKIRFFPDTLFSGEARYKQSFTYLGLPCNTKIVKRDFKWRIRLWRILVKPKSTGHILGYHTITDYQADFNIL
jgi:hypothetical protein